MNLRCFELAASSFHFVWFQLALWRNCDVGPKRVYNDTNLLYMERMCVYAKKNDI